MGEQKHYGILDTRYSLERQRLYSEWNTDILLILFFQLCIQNYTWNTQMTYQRVQLYNRAHCVISHNAMDLMSFLTYYVTGLSKVDIFAKLSILNE